MAYSRLLIFLLFLLACVPSALAQTGAGIKPYLHIGSSCRWLRDNSAALTLDDVRHTSRQKDFHTIPHNLGAFGVSRAAVWAYDTFPPAPVSRYLLVEFSNIDSVTLYYEKEGKVQTVYAGSKVNRDNPFVYPGFCFELPPGTSACWLRCRTGNAMLIPLALATAEGIPHALGSLFVLELLYAGIVLALFLYNLLLYTWIRDRSYAFYLGYLLALAVFILIYLRGFHVLFPFALSRFFSIYGIGFVAISYMFAVQFAIHFLKGDEYAPLITRILRFIRWALWIPVITVLCGWRPITITLSEIFSLAIPVLFILMAITAYRKGYRPARYFLSAWSLLLGAIMLFAITNMGLLPFGSWTFHILPVASAAEVILLSLALGHRYALLKREKIALQAASLQHAREMNEELEVRVLERTDELEDMMTALKASNAVKDKMLGIISHDLRTPLSTLSGILELLEINAVSPEETRSFAKMARQNVRLITESMQNMLNWALTQMNKIETVPVVVPLLPMYNRLIANYSFAARQKGIRMELIIADGLTAWGDGAQLEIVMRNLLDNAIKFTPLNGNITLGCKDAGATVELYVSDSGKGLRKDEIANVVYNSNLYSTDGTANEKGTGLGLWLCRDFVRMNGGELKVLTEPGRGATFYFVLPKKEPA